MTAALPGGEGALQARLEAAPSPLAILRETAARRPDHPALVFVRHAGDSEPPSLSYAALLDRVERAAAAFACLGVGEEAAVAILLPATPDAAVALVAATAVGIAFPMNPLLSAEALRAQLALARAKAVLTVGEHPALDVRARLREAAADVSIVEVALGTPTPEALRWDDLLAAERRPLPEPGGDRIAALFHTGGTTGDPKLAQLSARAVAAGALMAGAGARWREEDRIVCALPLFHVGGAIDVFLSAIAAGATVIFPGMGMRDPAIAGSIWSIVERTRATVLGAVPTSLAAIQNVPVEGADVSRLRHLATGGSPLPSSVAARIEAMTGRPVRQIYGMTETAGIIAAQNEASPDPGLNVGLPVPMMRVAIGAAGGRFEPGLHGNVFVKGPNLFAGYRTAAGVEGAPADGWVATGDIAEILGGGALAIRGRAKDVIIRSGHNIDPVAIEDAAAAHPDVVQAGAVGMPDAYAGELPVLFVALRPEAAVGPEELGAFVAERIPEPPARPKRVVILPELPLTPFGKVARYRLRQRAAETRAREVLADLPGVEEIACTDSSARCLALCFAAQAPADVAAQARERLAELGLEAEIA